MQGAVWKPSTGFGSTSSRAVWKSSYSCFPRQRGRLLEELHAQQKQIDCLDYLVYQLEKGLAATKEAPQEKPRRSVRREYH